MRRDALLAAGFAAAVLAGTGRAAAVQHPPRALDVVGYLLAGAAAASLAWRRSAPLLPLAATVPLTSVYLLLGYPFGPVLLAVVWAMFEYARRSSLRRSAVAGLVAAAVSVAAVLPRLAGKLDLLAVGLLLWAACWLAVPWSLGALARVRSLALARERRETVARAVLEERIRVSREVHDVAGHGFAVVAMQAGMALVVLDERPQQAREALEAIRATSKAALSELRGALDTATAPQVDIPALVDRARSSGLPVRLDCADLADVPVERQQLAYDVVRESLTNVLRHAAAAPTTVTVARDNGHLVVTVADAGPSTGDVAESRGRGIVEGRGITGMRERVESAGGSFAATPGDGFVVTARIPA